MKLSEREQRKRADNLKKKQKPKQKRSKSCARNLYISVKWAKRMVHMGSGESCKT
jgi:hypothetical protein